MSDNVEVERRKAERRINTLAALEDYVDSYIGRIETRLGHWIRRGLIAFSIIALACAVALVGLGILVRKNSSLISEIQKTRQNFVLTNCLAQNVRHDKAIIKFNLATNKSIKRNPAFAKQIKESRGDTENIINALAPKQDCKKLSQVAIGKAKPPPPVLTVEEKP